MVARSALVDVRPFRTGLIVGAFGLMLTLGRDQGGYLGQMLGGAVGVAIGATGSTILGSLLLVVGALLLSGRVARRDPPPLAPPGAPRRGARAPAAHGRLRPGTTSPPPPLARRRSPRSTPRPRIRTSSSPCPSRRRRC